MSWLLQLIRLASKISQKEAETTEVGEKDDDIDDDDVLVSLTMLRYSRNFTYPFKELFPNHLPLSKIVCEASFTISRSALSMPFSLFIDDDCVFKATISTSAFAFRSTIADISIPIPHRREDSEKYERLEISTYSYTDFIGPIQACLKILKQFNLKFKSIKFQNDNYSSDHLKDFPKVVRLLTKVIQKKNIPVEKLSILMPISTYFCPLIDTAYDQGCRWFSMSHCMPVKGLDSEIELSFRWIRKVKLFEEIFGTGPEAKARYAAAVEVMNNTSEPYNDTIAKYPETDALFLQLVFDPHDFDGERHRLGCFLVPRLKNE